MKEYGGNINMDFLDLARVRYSERRFDGRPLTREHIDLILEAGRVAPTAKNMQPQRIFLLESEEALRKLYASTGSAYGTKTAFLLCYDRDDCWVRDTDGVDSGFVDVSIVATHMMLEATNIGVGTTFVMWFDADKLKRELGLADNLIPVCILVAGYPSESSHPSQRHGERKDISETVWRI